ncbi:Hypothetical protein PHPALM_17083 [Phytophthora palmivora]|uniref:Uncharacterized protein n=1 Tax=Phytophthora palmivora TaxID=4796 RepID=A0A2P4XN55_9STRA|nr:Hypothetical protein PHPALM_17083 [Phytophthora palmivora]
MATDDLEFLNEVTAFLESETLIPGFTPRKSFEVDEVQPLLSDESVPSWVAISRVDADPLLKDAEAESYKSSSSEDGKSLIRKNKRVNDAVDVRRQKYRQKLKNERDELRQTANELSNQVRELIETKQGMKTTARTDLVLSKSFWRQVAIYQRKYRVRVEAEHERLLAIVNSQGVYIENMGNALRECPKEFNSLAVIAGNGDIGAIRMHDRIDDLKWLRLKSSVSALYTIYLQDVDDCYARVDQVFRDAEFATLPIGYRLEKTLSNGETVSIMKHVVSRRFIESDRVVIVWKMFSEGEGIFSGMDTDETGFSILRPQHDALEKMTLMMEDTTNEDAQKLAFELVKLLQND